MKTVQITIWAGLVIAGVLYQGHQPKELQSPEQQHQQRLKEAMEKSGMKIVEQEHNIRMVATMPKTKDPEKMSREEKNKLLVKVAIGALNAKDWDMMKKLYSPRFVQHLPGCAKIIEWEDFELAHRTVTRKFPTLRIEIEEIIAEADKVAVRLKTIITYEEGQTWGTTIEKQIEFTEIDIYRIENGRIIEEWCEFDTRECERKLSKLRYIKW